jgi:hypothetical protein
MVARSLLVAGVASLLMASPVLASPAMASPAMASAGARSGQDPNVPPPAQRIAATTATFNAIEAKIAAGQSLRLRFPDPTASADIIDYGVNDLWKKGNGVVTATVDTTGLAPGTYTVTITGRVLSQDISFRVRHR